MSRLLLSLVVLLMFSALLVQVWNPFGWGQRMFYGMHPPYHWVVQPLELKAIRPNSMHEQLVDTHGNICANVYHYDYVMDDYKVYGYGFSEIYLTQEQAERKAMQECQ